MNHPNVAMNNGESINRLAANNPASDSKAGSRFTASAAASDVSIDEPHNVERSRETKTG